jgi:hypothetical protein
MVQNNFILKESKKHARETKLESDWSGVREMNWGMADILC